MSELALSKVTVRNKLQEQLTNVRVRYAQSSKGTGWFSYATDWRNVNVETGVLVMNTKDVTVGDVPFDGEKSVPTSIPFIEGHRGYWQVYFDFRGKPYKINKNNAQVNPWKMDNGKYVEITVRYEGERIRIDFVMDSGNAYFYAQ